MRTETNRSRDSQPSPSPLDVEKPSGDESPRTPSLGNVHMWTLEQNLDTLMSPHFSSLGDQTAWTWCKQCSGFLVEFPGS